MNTTPGFKTLWRTPLWNHWHLEFTNNPIVLRSVHWSSSSFSFLSISRWKWQSLPTPPPTPHPPPSPPSGSEREREGRGRGRGESQWFLSTSQQVYLCTNRHTHRGTNRYTKQHWLRMALWATLTLYDRSNPMYPLLFQRLNGIFWQLGQHKCITWHHRC